MAAHDRQSVQRKCPPPLQAPLYNSACQEHLPRCLKPRKSLQDDGGFKPGTARVSESPSCYQQSDESIAVTHGGEKSHLAQTPLGRGPSMGSAEVWLGVPDAVQGTCGGLQQADEVVSWPDGCPCPWHLQPHGQRDELRWRPLWSWCQQGQGRHFAELSAGITVQRSMVIIRHPLCILAN